VIEVTMDKNIVWQYGTTGKIGQRVQSSQQSQQRGAAGKWSHPNRR
jgi:hypothetical protein